MMTTLRHATRTLLRSRAAAPRPLVNSAILRGRGALHVVSLKKDEGKHEHEIEHEEKGGSAKETKSHKEEAKHPAARKGRASEDVSLQRQPTDYSSSEMLPPTFRGFNDTLMQMQRQMDRMMNQFMGEDMFRPFGSLMMSSPLGLSGLLEPPTGEDLPAAATEAMSVMVPMDVQETDKAYIMSADVPGFSKDEIKASLTPDGVLTLSGERNVTEEQKEKEGRFLRRSRRFTNFSRSYRLPKDASTDNISAAVKDGILTVTVPKVAKEEVPHRDIPIVSS